MCFMLGLGLHRVPGLVLFVLDEALLQNEVASTYIIYEWAIRIKESFYKNRNTIGSLSHSFYSSSCSSTGWVFRIRLSWVLLRRGRRRRVDGTTESAARCGIWEAAKRVDRGKGPRFSSISRWRRLAVAFKAFVLGQRIVFRHFFHYRFYFPPISMHFEIYLYK